MNAGCTCGALSGAIMGLGLLVGPQAKGGLNKKKFRELSQKNARYIQSTIFVHLLPYPDRTL
jgi:hypothetical protein